MKTNFPLSLFIFFASTLALAQAPKTDSFQVGVVAGNIYMTADSAKSKKNSVGFGGLIGYSLAEELNLEVVFSRSKHDELTHNDHSVGIVYYFESNEPIYFSLDGGVSYLNHQLKVPGKKLVDRAFGVFAGLGADIYTKRSVIVGLHGRYHKMFGSDTEYAGTKYQLVDDYVSLLLRIAYQF